MVLGEFSDFSSIFEEKAIPPLLLVPLEVDAEGQKYLIIYNLLVLPKNIFHRHSHIGIDLDETLASTMVGMLKQAHSEGKLLHIQGIHQIGAYSIAELDTTLTDDVGSAIWARYGQNTMDPRDVDVVEGAIEGVSAFLDAGKNISIVTARSDQESWKVTRTQDWLQYHFPQIPTEDIFFVNHFYDDAKPKSSICLEKDITLMIDDSMENARDLVEHGIACILLEKPWNRYIEYEHPLLYRVKDWQEIIENLK